MPVHHIDLGPAEGQVAPPDVDAGVRRLIQATCSRGMWRPRVVQNPKPATIQRWICLAKLIRHDDTRTILRDRLPVLFGSWRADSLLSDWRGWLGYHHRRGPRSPYEVAQQLLAALPAHLVQRDG